jgi:hypothetical protein
LWLINNLNQPPNEVTNPLSLLVATVLCHSNDRQSTNARQTAAMKLHLPIVTKGKRPDLIVRLEPHHAYFENHGMENIGWLSTENEKTT